MAKNLSVYGTLT
jgi:chromosome segregation ATPase